MYVVYKSEGGGFSHRKLFYLFYADVRSLQSLLQLGSLHPSVLWWAELQARQVMWDILSAVKVASKVKKLSLVAYPGNFQGMKGFVSSEHLKHSCETRKKKTYLFYIKTP